MQAAQQHSNHPIEGSATKQISLRKFSKITSHPTYRPRRHFMLQVTLWTVHLYIVTIDSLATVHLSNFVDSLVTLLLVRLY